MKPLVASHTFLDTLETCPRQCYHKYVARTFPYEETEQMRWGNRVHAALEKRVRDGEPLPEEMQRWEPMAAPLARMHPFVEEKLGMTINRKGTGFFSSNVWCRGKVDVAVVQGDVCLILDWKTGKSREKADELNRFAMMLKANNSDLKVFKGRYVWLKEDRIGEEHSLDPDKEFEKTKRLMDQAEALKQQGGEWPARENGLCKEWCPVTTCVHNGRHK